MTRSEKIAFLISLMLLSGTVLSAGKEWSSGPSRLSSGKWVRMGITDDGVYKIGFDRLIQAGLEFPSNPVIICRNDGQLSLYNEADVPDEPEELPVYLFTGTDGIFNEGDYLLFYARSPHRWTFDAAEGTYSFDRHQYSDTAWYFLGSSQAQGKRITERPAPEGTPGYISSASDALYIHEVESENLIKSGRELFQPLSSSVPLTIDPDLKDLIETEDIRVEIRVLARASGITMFRLYEGQEIRQAITVNGVDLSSATGNYAMSSVLISGFRISSANPVFDLRFYSNGEPGARGWLDYLILQGRKVNRFSGNTVFLSDRKAPAGQVITEYRIETVSTDVNVWDVTDLMEPGIIVPATGPEEITFRSQGNGLRRFVAFSPGNLPSPFIKSSPEPNQDLHGSAPADMVIVTHPLFLEYAGKIADIHLNNSGLISTIVTPQQIYNEFSGGIQDISAIRNFLRMKYERQKGTEHPLRYLLLFGDGSYDNRKLPPQNPNFIPTYQSQNSTTYTTSYTSDDFYGLLEEGEGEGSGSVDIGIGRFPVSDTIEAGILVAKTRAYLDPSGGGDWKTRICIVADDEDENTHLRDAEGLSAVIRSEDHDFSIDKIYLDSFRQENRETGESYPAVNRAITDRINDGCLIFNYTGHGNENGLAHERILTGEDIRSWENGTKMPLFVTATCEFSRFDDAETNITDGSRTDRPSAGERVLLKKEGGGIALMSTSRLAYSAPNYSLNRNIFSSAFKREVTGEALRLGDIIKEAKNNTETGINKRNFILLGDPALRLAWPWNGLIVTDSVNGRAVSSVPDTIRALSVVTISGHIQDMTGDLPADFDLPVSYRVTDKEIAEITLANDGGTPAEYLTEGPVLARGQTIAHNGRFRFSFMVPSDMDFRFGPGKISYHAGEGGLEMKGSHSIIAGGYAGGEDTDTCGPVISLFMNDTLFRNGGITGTGPTLLVILSDESGINATGFGTGHDLLAIPDGDRDSRIVLNNYFITDINDFRKGKAAYLMSGLISGRHSVTVKAWDNMGNSSVKTLYFRVTDRETMIIDRLLNYPNPFISETRITAGLNRSGEELSIGLRIFTSGGRLIRIMNVKRFVEGYQLPYIEWDGTCEDGSRAGRGVYPYQVTIRTGSGETTSASGTMIILQ